jgi:hypothetical protein
MLLNLVNHLLNTPKVYTFHAGQYTAHAVASTSVQTLNQGLAAAGIRPLPNPLADISFGLLVETRGRAIELLVQVAELCGRASRLVIG